LNWALNHRKIVVAVSLGIFVGSLFLFKIVGTEFMPTMDQGQVRGTVELPVGTRVEATDQVMEKIEDIMEKEVPERKMMFARCGRSERGFGAMMGQRSDTHIITVGGRLVPKNERKRSDRDIAQALSKKIAKIPGIQTIDFAQQDAMQMISGGVKPVTVEIYGHDIAKTDTFAVEVKKIMDKIPGLTDVTISREKGKPELWVEVDRKKAASLGLNMAQIASTLRTKFYGDVATKYREGGEEYDTFVRLEGSDRQSIADLENAFVTSPLGKQIPISNIARIVERRGGLYGNGRSVRVIARSVCDPLLHPGRNCGEQCHCVGGLHQHHASPGAGAFRGNLGHRTPSAAARTDDRVHHHLCPTASCFENRRRIGNVESPGHLGYWWAVGFHACYADSCPRYVFNFRNQSQKECNCVTK